jgi:hypothetical protein
MSRVIRRRLVVALGKQGRIVFFPVGWRILPVGRRFSLIVWAMELSLGHDTDHGCGRCIGLLVYLRFVFASFLAAHSRSKIMAVSKQRAA